MYSGKLPTGLVLAGPNIASHRRLFEQFRMRLRDVDDVGPVVILTSKDASNLKGTLKKIIRDATEQVDGVDEDDEEIIIGRKVWKPVAMSGSEVHEYTGCETSKLRLTNPGELVHHS